MFIDDQKYTRGGKRYRRTLLRTSYRSGGKVRHTTIANLSKCTDDEIDALKFGLKHKGNLRELTNLDKKIKTNQGLGIGAVWVLFQIAKRLGIIKTLGKSK